MSSSNSEILHPRGNEMMLPHGGLPERHSPYLTKLIMETGGPFGPIGLQYRAQPELERLHFIDGSRDPLMEDMHEISEAPGLVYKYKAQFDEQGKIIHNGRALWTITRFCAAYCRFCTRGREVGIPADMESARTSALSHIPILSDEQIEKTLDYIQNEPGLNEIILSGGDPLTIVPEKLHYVLSRLRKIYDAGKLDIIRIGTRLPMQNPIAGIKDKHYEAIAQLRNPYMMVHINHPAELTPESLGVLERFRKQCGALVLSQTVLLKGVNDNAKTLSTLFNILAREGVESYYVFLVDPVYWAEHYIVPFDKVLKIMKDLRPNISGLAARARFVIDAPDGYGKIPIPEGDAWNVDYSAFKDFKGRRFAIPKE